MSRRIPCPTCRESGFVEVDGERQGCPTCHGDGMVDAPRERSAAYELGRARGYLYGRAEPTEGDWEHLHANLPDGDESEDVEGVLDEYMTGMLDGRDQATARKLGLPCPEAPSPEALAAAREVAS